MRFRPGGGGIGFFCSMEGPDSRHVKSIFWGNVRVNEDFPDCTVLQLDLDSVVSGEI
jgi:hypothetical protein